MSDWCMSNNREDCHHAGVSLLVVGVDFVPVGRWGFSEAPAAGRLLCRMQGRLTDGQRRRQNEASRHGVVTATALNTTKYSRY